MSTKALLISLKAEDQGHIEGFSDEYLLNAINEISLLRLVPKLQNAANGFYLLGDDFDLNRSTSSHSKSIIGAKAAQYVTSGMSIALDGGTTTLELAREIAEAVTAGELQNLRITLTSIQACIELTRTRKCIEALSEGQLRIWLIGGAVESTSRSIEPTSNAYLPWPIDVAFIGANAISTSGFFLPTPALVSTKKLLIKESRKVFIMADGSKIGKQLACQFATWNEKVTLITSKPTDHNARRAINQLPRRRIIYAS